MSIFGTPVVVTAGASAGATGIAAPALNTAAGDLLVVAVRLSLITNSISSITDTAGNLYTLLPVQTLTLGNKAALQIAYCLSAKANASNIITAHFTAVDTYYYICAWDVPIAGGTPEFDISAAGTSATSFAISTSSFNTSGTDEFIAAAATRDNIASTFSAGTGFSLDASAFPTSGGLDYGGAEHRTYSSAQTGITASGTWSNASDNNLMYAAAFKAAAASAAKPVVCIMQ